MTPNSPGEIPMDPCLFQVLKKVYDMPIGGAVHRKSEN